MPILLDSLANNAMPLLSRALLQPSTALLPFDYSLVRSARRRSIGIEVSRAKVVVRVPYFVAFSEAERFVRAKSAWIQQKLQQQSEQLEALPQRTYLAGSQLPFLNGHLTLVINRQAVAAVVQYGEQLIVGLASRSRLADEEQARRLVSQWYQHKALQLLRGKTDVLVAGLGLSHSGVTVKATRSKWGHCTAQGAIQYNWQILLAPEPVVDYLVAHEVSHLRHHNHSADFWQLVANLCPDYKRCRSWLKANGLQLTL
ncbi:MAG TPA: SprT family zinc-dependent metalloprotease [Cellvibrio sp.]|nr:SprT family zinc-dependent metalloprotease [Cellvibrio sp.]